MKQQGLSEDEVHVLETVVSVCLCLSLAYLCRVIQSSLVQELFTKRTGFYLLWIEFDLFTLLIHHYC